MIKKSEIKPIHQLFDDERKSGEILVAQCRLIILLLFVPLIYMLRFFLGYLLPEYWFLSIAKWGTMTLMGTVIYLILRRGFFRSYIGYITLLLDMSFVTTSIITLSFYKNIHYGALHDPLFIIYYLISVSSGLRYDYRYSIFSNVILSGIIVSLSLFDRAYHNIALDYVLLIDRLAVLVLVSFISIIFTRMLRNYILSRYYLGEKHVAEISSLLEIGRKISTRDELKKTLCKISDESKNLLKSDISFITLTIPGQAAVERYMNNDRKVVNEGHLHHSITGAVTGSGKPLIVNDKPSDAGGLTEIADQIKNSGIATLIGYPIIIDGGPAGSFVTAMRTDRDYTDYDHNLLKVLLEQATICIKNAYLLEELKNEGLFFRGQLDHRTSFENIIGAGTKMKEIFSIVERAAQSDIPVLIRGESGTGKELVANALQGLSKRKDRPFIKINCSAIPTELLESELFGHERGAFTGASRMKRGRFELAHGGTIFLDEIGDMSPGLQTKLLRVLQDREFERVGGEKTIRIDARIISATNQGIEEKIENNEFRKDLFYRINGLPIYIPPLRERKEDIPLLVDHFIKKYSDGKRGIELTVSAMRYLTSRPWRGNVRELENLIHRMIIMTDKSTISESDLVALNGMATGDRLMDFYSHLRVFVEETIHGGCDITGEVERIEREFISEAVKQAGGNIRKAGERINLPKSTLFNKIQKYKINP